MDKKGPVLTEFQITLAWERMLEAEMRSLYFGDLAARYARRKQWITGTTLFLSSGAAAAVLAQAHYTVPLLQSVVVAALTAYSISIGLDRRIATMARLHEAWNKIATDYKRLWSHQNDPDAELQFEATLQSENEPSRLATTEAPNDQKLLGKWQDWVLRMHYPTGQQ